MFGLVSRRAYRDLKSELFLARQASEKHQARANALHLAWARAEDKAADAERYRALAALAGDDVRELADWVRALCAGKRTLYPEAVVHDGNHEDDCDACFVFRLANAIGEDHGAQWWRTIRSGGVSALRERHERRCAAERR